MTGKKNKQVKLQPKHRMLAYSHKIVPELKVSGIWLEEAGFRAGLQVSITIEQNQLTIKPL